MADSSFDVRNGEPTSPWRQLQGLIGDAARVQARWAKATVTAAQAAGRGGAPGPGDLLRNIGSEYQKYLRDLTALNLQYARAVQQLAAASGERFTEAVEDAAPPGRRVVAEASLGGGLWESHEKGDPRSGAPRRNPCPFRDSPVGDIIRA